MNKTIFQGLWHGGALPPNPPTEGIYPLGHPRPGASRRKNQNATIFPSPLYGERVRVRGQTKDKKPNKVFYLSVFLPQTGRPWLLQWMFDWLQSCGSHRLATPGRTSCGPVCSGAPSRKTKPLQKLNPPKEAIVFRLGAPEQTRRAQPAGVIQPVRNCHTKGVRGNPVPPAGVWGQRPHKIQKNLNYDLLLR